MYHVVLRAQAQGRAPRSSIQAPQDSNEGRKVHKLGSEPEDKQYVVRVVWDTSAVEEVISEIRIRADQVSIETPLGQERVRFLLRGRVILNVPVTNFRGYEEEG